MYEDLSTPEEEEEEEEEEEQTVPTSKSRQPLTHRPPAKPPSKPLRSAKEIVLTESEEESDSGVLQDEDFSPAAAKSSTSKVKHKDLLDIFTGKAPPSPSEPKEEKSSPKNETKMPPKKSTGLLIGNWGSVPTAQAKEGGREKGKEAGEVGGDSPDMGGEGRRERKKKRSKRSRKELATAENGQSSALPPAAMTTAVEDPFGITSSLDAWLNTGPSTGLVSHKSHLFVFTTS